MRNTDAFESPTWSAPLDVEGRIARAPEDATARGMFLQELADAASAARAAGSPTPHYTSFASYPMREYMRLMVDSAAQVHPTLPLRAALRQLGRRVYPNFAATMVGAAIFSVAGRDFSKVAALAGRAYSVSISPGNVTIRAVGPNQIVVRMREIWAFPDAFQVGVWEGAMDACHATGEVRIRVLSDCDVDYFIEWS